MTSRTRLHSCALLAGVTLASVSGRAAPPLDEKAAVLLVCKAGPSAAVARAERLRGQAEVDSAAVLPNPSLVATHQRALTGSTDTETIVGLSVPLGIGGRHFILQDAASARRRQAERDAQAILFDSAIAFRQAYVSAVADQARVQVAGEQQAALEKLSDVIRHLVKGGEAGGYELLRYETQAKLHRRTLESLRAKAARSRTLLSAWIAEEVTLPTTALAALAGGSGHEAPMSNASQNPRVQSFEAAAQASRLEARAAHRRWVPDLEVFAGYRTTDVATETGHGVSLGITIPLTFFDHGQGEGARAEAEAALAQAAATAMRRQQTAEVNSALAELAVLQAQVRESEALVNEAFQVQVKAQQLYAAGEGSITELLESFRSAEEARFALISLGEDIAKARLSIMRSTGSLMDPNLDKYCGRAPRGTP